MTACYCDYDGPLPSVYKALRLRARCEHKCTECGQPILRGETYERVWAIWDGGPDVIKTCCDCLAIRDGLETMDCFCWGHHNLWDDIMEHLNNADFPPGARFGYLRLIATHRRTRARRA